MNFIKTILVTGGAGFIGSHTCLLLLERGYKIIVIDKFINSSKLSLEKVKYLIKKKCHQNQKNIKIFEGDLRDKEFVEKVFAQANDEGFPIKGVIHFAGLKSVADSLLDPLKYWDTNVVSSINLFQIMEIFECRTIVFSSSATIYGLNNNSLVREEDKIAPINPYGKNKATIEQILLDIYLADSKRWKVINLRYFNPIGAHQSGLIGESPMGSPNNIFPIILNVAQKKLKELKIYGNDWPTSDGTGVRDYIHVMDLAEAHLAALEFLFEDKKGFVNLNIGTGNGTTVLELVKTFEEVNKIKIPYTFTGRRKGDLSRVVANNEKAISLIDWKPKRDLKEMCRDGWNWQNKNPSGYYS